MVFREHKHMESQKIIIYSVNTNNYDDFLLNKKISSIFALNLDIEYYLFTDKLINSSLYPYIKQILISKTTYKNKYTLNYPSTNKTLSIPDGINIDRFIKLNPIEILPNHNISIYHDARIILYPKIINEISKYNLNFDLLSMKHRFRRSFEEELLICFAYKKIDLQKYINILNFAHYSKFTSKENKAVRLSENGLIIRKNNPLIIKLSKLWTRLTIITIRDQLSLPLSLNYLKNLNLQRKFFKDNFTSSKIAHVRSRKNNYSKFIDFFKKLIFSLRFVFIYLLNFFIKFSFKT